MLRGLYIIFLILFLEPQISNTLVWLHYEFNVEAITEAFCENKDKPELKCNGQCHLAKQLTDTELNSNTSEDAIYLPLMELFYQMPALTLLSTLGQQISNTPKPSLYSFSPVFKILQPPRL